MTLSELRDLIRAEADIQGLSSYTNLIDNLINAELQRLTGKSKYEELKTTQEYTLSVDGEYSFTLPTNFQLFDSLVYAPTPPNADWDTTYTLTKGKTTATSINTIGRPFYWFRYQNTLQIYPYSDAFLGDVLILSYYKIPELLLDEDIFPVESLFNPVQLYVMSRMLRLKNTKASMVIRAEADQAYRDSRSLAFGS